MNYYCLYLDLMNYNCLYLDQMNYNCLYLDRTNYNFLYLERMSLNCPNPLCPTKFLLDTRIVTSTEDRL